VRPLDGIAILDLSRLAPGPYCSMLLSDMGADVLRIEEPGPPEGRRARDAGGIRSDPVQSDRNRAHNALQRGKRSIALNLKTAEGRKVFYQLLSATDVLLEEFRPGVTERLGIDYESVSKVNPRIVYCSLTGYGQGGPYRTFAGHDINYIALGGALGLIGQRDTIPAIPMNLIADMAAGGLQAALGIMLALYARDRTGRGQHVDISMLDGVLSLLASAFSSYFATGVVPERGTGPINGGSPFYNVFATKDGKYLSIGAMEPWFFANLCRALCHEELIEHQRDPAWGSRILQAFQQAFLSKTRDEWFSILSQTDTCVAKVYTLDEVCSDTHVLERQMVEEINDGVVGAVKQIGVSIKLSDTPGRLTCTAPKRGEHTEELLTRLGYSKAQIEELRTQDVIP
jgi:crotonobetainyl-CoA:carnitine CoA-transferase CaiB-like acyl-CoA transferase